MWVASTLGSTTFKPQVDRCMAADGTDIVLWATDRLLIRLGYQKGEWQVSRHIAAHPAENGRGRAGTFCWCGRFYREEGESVAELNQHATAEDWNRVYRECFASATDSGTVATAS